MVAFCRYRNVAADNILVLERDNVLKLNDLVLPRLASSPFKIDDHDWTAYSQDRLLRERQVIWRKLRMYPLVISDLSIDQLLDAIHNVTGAPLARVPADQKSMDGDTGYLLVAGDTESHS